MRLWDISGYFHVITHWLVCPAVCADVRANCPCAALVCLSLGTAWKTVKRNKIIETFLGLLWITWGWPTLDESAQLNPNGFSKNLRWGFSHEFIFFLRQQNRVPAIEAEFGRRQVKRVKFSCFLRCVGGSGLWHCLSTNFKNQSHLTDACQAFLSTSCYSVMERCRERVGAAKQTKLYIISGRPLGDTEFQPGQRILWQLRGKATSCSSLC